MGGFIEKIKDLFSGRFVYKAKKKKEESQPPPESDAPSAQSASGSQPEKIEEKPQEQK